MKKNTLLLLLFCFCMQASYSQQKIAREKYYIKADQEVYFKIKDTLITYNKGWVITEVIGGKTIQRTLSEKETKKIQIDTIIKLEKKWFVGEVKHSDDKPDKLIINPWIFKDSSNLTKLNTKGYIKIPENGYVRLKKTYFKWSAITIPFAIRPALNDSISNKITTDLNLGASFSWNIGWETFKNRRIKVKKSSYGISFGIGTGFTKISLDKDNTSLDNEPLKNSEDGLGLFIAPGIGVNIRGFQLVGFLGYDIGLTKNVQKWNYNGKPYFGIGLGIDLSTLGKL